MSATTSIKLKRKICFQVASDLHEHDGQYDTSDIAKLPRRRLPPPRRTQGPQSAERHLIPLAPNFHGYFDFLARMCQKLNRVIVVLKHCTHQP